MRKEEIFFDAITNIRENLVEEAQNYAFRRRVRWQKWAGLAACLALAAFLSLPFLLPSGGNSSDSSGGVDSNTSSAPSAADQATPGASEGGDSGDAISGETAPQAPVQGPTGDDGMEMGDLFRFTATVLEVRETELLVAPEAGSGIAAQVLVPMEELDVLPALQEGDQVAITCHQILETEPARAADVVRIDLLPSEE